MIDTSTHKVNTILHRLLAFLRTDPARRDPTVHGISFGAGHVLAVAATAVSKGRRVGTGAQPK